MQPRRVVHRLPTVLRRVGSVVLPSARDRSDESRPVMQSTGEADAGRDGALLQVVVDSFPLRDVSWQQYYLSVSSVGLTYYVGQYLGIRPVSGLDSILPVLALFLMLVLGGVYQLYTRVVLLLPAP